MVLRLWPSHHKNADIREALQATLVSPKFSWSPSAIWTIFTSSRMVYFDHPTLSGPKQGLSVDSLFLISISCWEGDEEVKKGDVDRKKKKGIDPLPLRATTYPRICKVEMQQASLLYYSAKPQSGGIWGCALVCPTSLYVRTRVHKNKSMQRLISSLWGPGTAKFQVTWLLRIVQNGVSVW